MRLMFVQLVSLLKNIYSMLDIGNPQYKIYQANLVRSPTILTFHGGVMRFMNLSYITCVHRKDLQHKYLIYCGNISSGYLH